MPTFKRICIVVASEMTVKAFLMDQITALSGRYDVTLIVNTKQSDFAEQNGLSIKVIPLAIERDINPVADILALYRLVRLFHHHRFDLIHSVTPKAGLLAMLAGKIAGIRFRIHTFTGQVWATRKGFSHTLLKTMDRLLALSATHLLADSASQRKFLIDHGIASPEKLNVLAEGSISGVDAGRFRPDPVSRSNVRGQLRLGDDDILLLFLGRLNRDKGVLDLAAAFADVAAICGKLHLLLAGPDEGGLKEEVKRITNTFASRVHFVDYTDKPESCFAAADIFCLPSYREGFGSVIIEAAACGVPAIGSRIYGVTDAIDAGKSGLLHEPGNAGQLADCMRTLAEDAVLRHKMGEYARDRAVRSFSSAKVTEAWLEYYDTLL